MLLHVANYFEADRRTAVAGEAIPLGSVIKINDDNKGFRRATIVQDAQASSLVAGNYGVALKVSSDPLQVSSSTVTDAAMGSRLVSILSGDLIVECRRGSIMEYDVSLLDASITAANVQVGEALAVKSGKFCKAAVAGAITSPVIGRVYNIHNGKVRVEIV